MTRLLRLEDFTSRDLAMAPATAMAAEPAPETAEATLAVFEEGYRNGWDDCAKAEAEAQRKIGADLAANLENIAVTYAEARQDVLAALGPLFEDIAASLLPRLAAEAVAPAVVAELRAVAGAATGLRAVVIAAPAALPALERIIGQVRGIDVDLQAEPAFAEGQVSIRHAGERRDVDLTDAARTMAEAIRGFVAQETEGATPAPTQKGVA